MSSNSNLAAFDDAARNLSDDEFLHVNVEAFDWGVRAASGSVVGSGSGGLAPGNTGDPTNDRNGDNVEIVNNPNIEVDSFWDAEVVPTVRAHMRRVNADTKQLGSSTCKSHPTFAAVARLSFLRQRPGRKLQGHDSHHNAQALTTSSVMRRLADVLDKL